jgi:hypothetical protein
MTSAPETLRASDDERERTGALLREHCQHGRLSVDELADRLSLALAARTRGELDALVGDLPAQRPHATAGALRSHMRTFLLVNGLLVSIWLVSGAGYFWPMWPFLGWGVGLAAHALGGDGTESKSRRSRNQGHSGFGHGGEST